MDYRVFPSRIALVNLFLAAAHLVACSDDEGPTPPTVGDDDPGADGGTGGPGTGGDGGDSAESFRVTYSANGADRGTVPRDEQGYGAGTTVTVLDNEGDLARADYPFFSGWNSAADGGGESYSGGEPLVMPEGGITLYATWLDEAKLLAPRGGAEDYFGAQIDVQGDYAIIASIEETGGGFVSIHQRTGANDWDDGFRIETEEGSSDFGSSVLLVDDYALVGASRSGQYGAVFVYRRTGANEWTKHDTLTPPDDSAASFGSSLVANGDRLFIGDDGDGDAGRAAGAVHVYRRVAAGTWAHRQKITPQGDGDFDLESGQFGHSLDVDGEHLVVGVRGRFLPSGNRAYFLSETDLGWQHVASVTEGPDDSNFGNSVAIQGEFAIIGASWTNDDSGAVYVYQREGTLGWRLVRTLSGAPNSGFGESLALAGDFAFVGAPGGEVPRGAVHMFRLSDDGWDWENGNLINPKAGSDNDYFGASLVTSDRFLFVGATSAADLGTESGSVTTWRYR